MHSRTLRPSIQFHLEEVAQTVPLVCLYRTLEGNSSTEAGNAQGFAE